MGLGQVLDFETLPNGATTSEFQVIFDEYESAFGVSFQLLEPTDGSPAGFPIIAEVGSPLVAFNGCDGADTPRLDQGLGSRFLGDDAVPSNLDLLVTFSNPVAQASGVLIDVDCRDGGSGPCEQFTITARGSLGESLDLVTITGVVGSTDPECTSGTGGPSDGLAQVWFFDRPQADIHSILFQSTGDGAARQAPVAFDNFSPTTIGAPPTVRIASDPFNKLCTGESTLLQALVETGLPPFSFQWQVESTPGTWTDLGTDATQNVSPAVTTHYRVRVVDFLLREVVSQPFELPVCVSSADLDGDGDVDMGDFQIFQAQFAGPLP